MFEFLEKLINEHGSAAIIRERLRLIEDEYAALERRCADLQTENDAMKAELEQLRLQVHNHDAATSPYVCDHCGSARLKRTGSRPHPMLGDLGLKDMVFECLECGRETLVTPPDD